MSAEQLTAIIITIIGSGGIWKLIENRLNRRDKLKDQDVIDVREFEKKVEACVKSNIQILCFLIMPWQERVMSRSEKLVGIEEHDMYHDLYKAYKNLGGNGTVERRQNYIEEVYSIVPDDDISHIETVGDAHDYH